MTSHVDIPNAIAGAVEATVEGGALDGATALLVNGRNLAFMVVGTPEWDGLKGHLWSRSQTPRRPM